MASKRLPKPVYPAMYRKYVQAVKGNALTALNKQLDEIAALLKKVNKSNIDQSYAKGKWTLKEVLVHMIDTEQIFAYRALAIARGEKKALPGFDQDKYIKNANLENITKKQIADNFKSVRKSSLFLFDTFGPEDWVRIGRASARNVSASAFPYMIAGHTKHHINVIKKKYLK